MRQLLLTALLVCSLTSYVRAGDPHDPGNEDDPPCTENCAEGSSATMTDDSGLVWILVNGVWVLFTIG